MTQLRVLALACSTYEVESDGKIITMVSTAFGAPAVYDGIVDVLNANNAIDVVATLYALSLIHI